MNRQSKFSLADVLTLLTALAFGFVCFLGTNFYTLGRINQSILLAVIIAVLLYGTAFGAKLLKRASRDFKTCFVWEMVLLVVFTLFLAFFSYSPFPHFFNVSAHKTEIRNNLDKSITQAENMFTEYERYAENREKIYKSKLQSVANAKSVNPSEYTAYGFENDGVDDSKQIENKMFTVHADLFPTNYEEMKKVDSQWLTNAESTLNNGWAWNFGIVDVVNNIEQNSKDWLGTLAELSKVREKGEQADDFEYPLQFDDTKKYFTLLEKPTGLSIGLAAATWVLMMLSWFVTKRHTRFPGLNDLFGCGEKAKNEL
jgi:hypothetical protein